MADSNNSVAERVSHIIAHELGRDTEEITFNTSFIDDLQASSVDIIELILALEDEFKLEIPDEEVEKIQTVQDAVDFIERSLI